MSHKVVHILNPNSHIPDLQFDEEKSTDHLNNDEAIRRTIFSFFMAIYGFDIF